MATMFLDNHHSVTNCAKVSLDENSAHFEFHKALAAGTDDSLVHPMLALSRIYHSVALSCREQLFTTEVNGALQLTTIFRRPIRRYRDYGLRVQHRSLSSRFTLDDRSTNETVLSGSFRRGEGRPKHRRYGNSVAVMGPEYLRYYREIFAQHFPDIRAQWIFLTVLGFAELLGANVPKTKIARYIDGASSLLYNEAVITQTSQDIRFSSNFAHLTLDQFEGKGPIYLRAAEPTVISNGDLELHGSFGYEIANTRGTMVTLETGFLLTPVR